MKYCRVLFVHFEKVILLTDLYSIKLRAWYYIRDNSNQNMQRQIGDVKGQEGQQRSLVFNKTKIQKLKTNYSPIIQIFIICNSTTNASNNFIYHERILYRIYTCFSFIFWDNQAFISKLIYVLVCIVHFFNGNPFRLFDSLSILLQQRG
jgi:hypothetical protein